MEDNVKIKEALEALKATTIAEIKKVEEKADKKLSAEELTAKIEEKLAPVNASIKTLEEAISKSNFAKDPTIADQKKKFSFAKVLQFIGTGDRSVADFELGFNSELLKAANMSTATGPTGGLLIAEELSSDIQTLAYAAMPIMQMGVTSLTNLTSDFVLPKISARPTGYNVAENATVTPSGVTFSTKTMRPKRIAAFTKVSNRLIRQANASVEQVVREELARAYALKLHRQLIDGTGTENQIKGLKSHSSLTSTTAMGTNGGRFTVDKAAEMLMNLDNANMLTDSSATGFVMAPNVLWGLRRERVAQYSGDSAGAPVLVNSPLMSRAQLEAALGFMLRSTTDISQTNTKGTSSTCSDVFAGDWKLMWIGSWGPMEFKRSDVASDGTDHAFLQDLLFILVQGQQDMVIRDETGFTTISDAESSAANW